MSYQEKKTVLSIVTGVLLMASYAIYALGRARSGAFAPDDMKSWAVAMLIFIGIGIAAMIVIQIVFHILLSVAIAVRKQTHGGGCNEKEIERTIELEMVEDEMDKLIGLKAMRFGFGIAGAGFILALGSLLLGHSPAVMLNILFAAFSVGSVAEGFAQLYYYRSGVRHG